MFKGNTKKTNLKLEYVIIPDDTAANCERAGYGVTTFVESRLQHSLIKRDDSLRR